MSAPVKYDVDGRVMIDGQSVVKSYANGLAFTAAGKLAVNSIGVFDPSRGYEPPVAYAAGIDLVDASQTVEYLGQVYAPVLADLPFTTSGTFETAKFRLIQGVASTDLAASSGAAMVGFIPSGIGAVATTVQAQLRKGLTAVDYGAGIVITEPGQLLRDTDGGLWNINPTEPLPYTTTGAGLPEGGALVSVGDAVLRQELALAGGSALVEYDGGTVEEVLDYAKPLADYTALRNYTGRATGVRITQSGLAGFFERLSSASGLTDNGGTVIIDGAGRAWRRLFSGAVNVRWFGAKGDGVTDDTAAIQAAVSATPDMGVLSFGCRSYAISYAINLGRGIVIDLSGANILNLVANIFCFFVSSSNVIVRNGFFYGNRIGIMQIDTLSVAGENKYTGIKILKNTVECSGNQSVVLTYAITPDLQFAGNICVATGATGGFPWVSSGLRIVNTKSGTSESGVRFADNYFNGYRAPYNSEVDTPNYLGGSVLIDGNIILNSDRPISTYHHRNCKVVNNYVENYSTPVYVWQQSEWRGNTFKNYTGTVASVKIEALLSVFAGNTVDTSAGSGILYDGSGSAGVISENTIRNVAGFGIDFFPTYNVGGQPVSVQIKDNVIYGCGSHGLYAHSADSIRGIHIYDNRISGVGRLGAPGVDYAGIKIDTTAGRDIIAYIKNNTLFGNDSLNGISDSKFSAGIWINDLDGPMGSCLIADNDISITTPLLWSIRSVSGANIICTGNRVTSFASLSNVPIGSQVIAGKQMYPQPITEFDADLNGYNYDGVYTTPPSGLSNLPLGWIQARYTVVVFGATGSNSGMQIITGRNTDSNEIAVRTRYNGTWKSWRII